MERLEFVEEKVSKIEEILEKSGISLLAQMNMSETISENLGLILEPQNLQAISILARLLEQREAIERLIDMIDKLEKSGALAFFGYVSENFGEGLGMVTEPRVLRIISNIANILEILSRMEPTAISMMASALERSLSQTFTPEVMRNPPKVGLLDILKQLSDPEVQKALGIIFLLLKAIGKAFYYIDEDMKNIEAMISKMMKK
ncbi:MAG: DUF1641 domain-containing protein [candidate division WOR-3 bacterium]